MSIETQATHPAEDALELYCLGRLEEEPAAAVEEHLLVCPACQARTAELDSFLRAARTATAELRQEARYRAESGPRFSWSAFFGKPMWAAGAVAALFAVAIPVLRRPADPVAIELAAYRGAEIQTGAGVAKAGTPLILHVDLTGLNTADCQTMEIVNSNGETIAKGPAALAGGKAQFPSPQQLRAGQYWVRVLNGSGVLLREVGLRLE